MGSYYNHNTQIFVDGNYIHPQTATPNLYSQSLHYGNGVFEGIRAYDTKTGTKIFKAEDHFQRLLKGAEVMQITCNYTVKELIDISYTLLEKNQFKNAYIRPLITTGQDMSLYTSSNSSMIIQCWEWGKYMGDQLLRVKTSKFQRPNPKSCFVESKVTGHYVNSILSTNEAKNAGYDEALLLDMNNNVAECSGANVFMEKDGQLFTPAKGHIMPGITRATIIDICKDENIPVSETVFTLDELKQADSAFFVGTAAEVVGLQSLDDYHFPKPWNQSLGHRLMHLYQQEVLGERHQNYAKAI